MGNQTRYNVCQRNSTGILGAFLMPWEIAGKELSFDEVRKVLPKEDRFTTLVNLTQKGFSTVLRYRFDNERRSQIEGTRGQSNIAPVPIPCVEYRDYKIIPPIKAELQERFSSNLDFHLNSS